MNLTIIAQDKAVYLDGGVLTDLDFSETGILENVHSLQWKTNIGWIQFSDGSNIEVINVLPDWAESCISVFNEQYEKNKLEAAAQIEMQQAQAVQNQPKTHGTMVI